MPIWAAILLAIAVTPLAFLVWWSMWGDDITKLFKKEKKMFKVNEMPFFGDDLLVVCKETMNVRVLFDETRRLLRDLQIAFWYRDAKYSIHITSYPGNITFLSKDSCRDGLRGSYITASSFNTLLTNYEELFKNVKGRNNMATDKLYLFERLATETTTEQDIWIWIEGYKGTNKDLTCRDYQFELGKQFDMPEGARISTCSSGFHLSVNLKDTFKYYSIKDGHRFFRVRALVRKSEYDRCVLSNTDKIVAKSILFMYEMTADEILHAAEIEASKWTEEDKLMALEKGTKHVELKYRKIELTELGYSETFSQYLIDNGMDEVAKVVGSQKDLSMDMKVLMILKDEAPVIMNCNSAITSSMKDAFHMARW